MTDLSIFGKRSAHEHVQQLQVVDPLGRATDITISCLGYLSDAFAQAKLGLASAVLEGESYPDAKARLLAAVVVGWEGITDDGQTVEYSHEKAIELLREYPGLAEQVDRFISKNENFTRG